MATIKTLFKFDPRGLPDSLTAASPAAAAAAQEAFVRKVAEMLQNDASDPPYLAAVVGMLVLDGFADPTTSDFSDGFWQVRGEAAGSVKQSDGVTDVPNKQVYADAVAQITKLPAHRDYVYYQELAAVARKLIANAHEVPPDVPSFLGQVRSFADDYSTQGPEGDTLDLPNLTQVGAADSVDDLKGPNIRAVAVIHAACQLEKLGLFRTVDRVTETFMNGQLPVGFDRGGRALDDYYWTSEFRLSEAARHTQYSRVLGEPSSEKLLDVQPNTLLGDHMIRFISALAEYDRQQRVADIVGGQRASALTLTAEQVRSAGRNLAANASLYGWGGTQFAARRLADHVHKAFKILGAPEIQNAYGVDGPWKVIERVSAQEFGTTPNIVKYRTLADAGQKILNLVAKYAAIWSGSTGRPLFEGDGNSGTAAIADAFTEGFARTIQELTRGQASHVAVGPSGGGGPAGGGATAAAAATATATADISHEDEAELMRQAGNWLSVTGTKSDQVEQYSEPSESQYAPSIPTLAPAAQPGGNGGDGIDQLRQMVSSGQVPSLDQLKSLVLPGAH